MRPEHDDTELRRWLRRGDPAADGSELTTGEAARLRRRMLDDDASPASPIRWLGLGAAAAAAVAAVALQPVSPAPSTSRVAAGAVTGSPSAGAPSGHAASAGDERRQIRFATGNGTQIIWILDPKLEL
jgi:hypothetical protein